MEPITISPFDRTKGLAEHPSILDDLEKEIRRQGFAGPPHLPQLIYLVLLTGMSDRPVSLVVKGPSGAGKSYSLNMALQFVPPVAYERFEGMTEKALVYLKGLVLKHKHLVIGEASGMADGDGRAHLRQLLSEGRVRYATVQSTANGLVGAELPMLEGPTGLIMTTTAVGLHPEDESRMLSVNITESPEQIAEALLAQALGTGRRAGEPDLDPWHALYECMLENKKDVLVPYAKEIAKRLPTTHDRIKRDFPHVLSLIGAHATLHSLNRQHLEGGTKIEANLTDYEVVRNLVNPSLSQGLAVAVPDGVRMVVEGVEQCLGNLDPFGHSVSQIKLAEQLNRDPSVISRNVKKALDLGYLRNENPGQGREARLAKGEVELPSGSVLPPKEELA